LAQLSKTHFQAAWVLENTETLPDYNTACHPTSLLGTLRTAAIVVNSNCI
jgi:hypothetical protein